MSRDSPIPRRHKPSPDQLRGQVPGGPGDAAPPPGASGPTIFTAFQKHLGLKRESQNGRRILWRFDHVEGPSEN